MRPAEKWPANVAFVKPDRESRGFCYAGRMTGFVRFGA